MDAVMSLAEAEAEAAVAMDAVMCQTWAEPEAEAAVQADAVVRQAEAEAGGSGGRCGGSSRGKGRQQSDWMLWRARQRQRQRQQWWWVL